MTSLLNFTTHFKYNTNPFQNLPKIGEEGILSNLFTEVNITLIPKPGKDTTGKHKAKQKTNILISIVIKIFNKILVNKFNSTLKRLYFMTK